MKTKMKYRTQNGEQEAEIFYIPVRFILAILLLVLETLSVITIVIVLSRYVPYFYLAVWATEIGCIVKIIASDDNPDYKIPWLMVVLLIPVAGLMLYILFYSRKLQPKFVKRMDELKHNSYSKDDAELFVALEKESSDAYAQAKMLCNIYPYLSRLLNKCRGRISKIACIILTVFMAANLLVSSVAVLRWRERTNDMPPSNKVEEMLDQFYDDEK